MKPFPLPHKQQLGKLGEDLAVTYLKNNGYRIIDRNFKIRYGEIDIICVKDGTLVFVEVKTRTGSQFGTPVEAVTPWKLREIVKTAGVYKLSHPSLPDLLRIDVIGISVDSRNIPVSFRHLVSVT